MNGNSLLKEIGRSYIVSSFIPASLFVFLSVILFRDFVPPWFIKRFEGNIVLIDGSIAFLALCSLWLAFALYSSQDPITKLFEGYYLPWGVKSIFTMLQKIPHWFKSKRINKTRELLEQPNHLGNRLDFEKIYPYSMSDFQRLELQAPIESEHLLPTRLGNVLRASEIYPYDRYGIDAITIWPRLYNFLPHVLKDDLEKINNQLAFLLNSSLLMLILSFACLFVALIQNICIHQTDRLFICTKEIWLNGFQRFPYSFFYFSSFIGGIFSYFLYRLGINSAVTYGLYIRTSYDLYRDRLLEHLNKSLTEKLDEEMITWSDIGDFYVAGQYLKKISFGKKKNQPRMKFNSGLILAGGLAAGLVYRMARYQRNR